MTAATLEKPTETAAPADAPAAGRLASAPPREPDLLVIAFWLLWVCLGAIFVLVADLAWWVVGFILVVEVACIAVLLREVSLLLERPDLRFRDRR